MSAPRALDINVESLDSQLDNRTATAADLGNDLLDQAQQAESGQAALLDTTGLESRYNDDPGRICSGKTGPGGKD